MRPERVKQLIEVGLTNAQIFIKGEGTHFKTTVVCPGFIGKSTLKRHQMVYGTLGRSFEPAVNVDSRFIYQNLYTQGITAIKLSNICHFHESGNPCYSSHCRFSLSRE